MINFDLKNKVCSKVLQCSNHSNMASVLRRLQSINWIFHNYLHSIFECWKNTEVPEETVERGLHTAKFMPTVVGLCVGDCVKLTAQNSVTEINKFVYQLIATIQIYI